MGRESPPSLQELIRKRVVLAVPGMEAVRARHDLPYKTADDQPLYMDVYSPPERQRPCPVVILVHGGPIPVIGARRMGVFVSYGELLAASGFVAIAFDHRFLAPARLPEAGGDVADLIAHVRANADALGIDPERVALWAFSGGGPFIAAGLRERPAYLRAVVAYYAVLDLPAPAPENDGGIGPSVREAFSPVEALGEDARSAPPVLVARAGRDDPQLNGGLDRFVQAALTRGAALDLLNHPEGRHGFDILDDDDRSKQIIRRTLEFLRDCLAP